MKQLVPKVLGYIPKYLLSFASLIAGPKRFIAKKHAGTEDAFEDSLAFLGMSLALTMVFQFPLLFLGDDFSRVLQYGLCFSAVSLVGVFLFSCALHLAWWLVGGKSPFRSFFITHAYFFGVLSAVYAVFHIFSVGVFKILDPHLLEDLIAEYRHMIENSTYFETDPEFLLQLMDSLAFKSSYFILLAGSVIIFIWFSVAWGAYRQLNGLDGWHSFFAFLINAIFAIPILVIIVVLSNMYAPILY